MIGRGKHFRYYIERGDQLENEINKIKTKHFMNCQLARFLFSFFPVCFDIT